MNRMMSIALAALAVIAVGCINRKERITIYPDGSVKFKVKIEGDPQDVRNGDALPTVESGWDVTETIEKQDDGKETLKRTAKLKIAPGRAIPDSYAQKGGRLARTALRFPTTLVMEDRDEGTYYHLKRTYVRRPFNFAHYFEDKYLESEEFKAIVEKAGDELTAAEHAKLAEVLIEIDELQTAAFVERAAARIDPPLAQDVLLQARQAALRVYQSEDLSGQMIDILKSDRDDAFENLENTLRESQDKALSTSLTAAGVHAGSVSEFMDLYALTREAYEITEDLEDETWEVVVEMPGRIVAHNSFETSGDGEEERESAEPGFSIVKWTFSGDALRDRDVVLMATSFVPTSEE